MNVELVRRAIDLGALKVGGALSSVERSLITLAEQQRPAPESELGDLRAAIRAGEDPLGEALLAGRSLRERRRAGAFFTPAPLVDSMLAWVLARKPARLVDAGCGSGRFAVHAARSYPDLPLVAIDVDPVATLCTRAALACIGARRARVLQLDYTRLDLPPVEGATAFIGNPPYVRHHGLSKAAKTWAAETARALGHKASGLAGLHALFYLKTAALAREGDLGCFVTSAEWLDVGYGALIRDLLLDGLGCRCLHVVDPRAIPFRDAMATAAISCFEVGSRPPSMRMRRVARPERLGDLDRGRVTSRRRLEGAARWSPLLSPGRRRPRAGKVKLGDVARVHRGVATGCNEYFVLERGRARDLGLELWCRPVVTSARQLLASGGVMRAPPERELSARLLLDIPGDVEREHHPKLHRYLVRGETRQNGSPAVAARYLPSHRSPWWRLGLPEPPPIIASYMARQPPVFALNPDGLAILNIAHGIYPIEPLSPSELEALVGALNRTRAEFAGSGRTYHGGLEKFEPREMERLPLP